MLRYATSVALPETWRTSNVPSTPPAGFLVMICARPAEKVGVTATSGVCERATIQFAIGSQGAWYMAVQVGGFCSSWPALWQAVRAQSDTRLKTILLFMRPGCLERRRFSTGLPHRTRHFAPALEHLRIDLAP